MSIEKVRCGDANELYEYLIGFYSQAGLKGLNQFVAALKPFAFFSRSRMKSEVSFPLSFFVLTIILFVGRKKCVEHNYNASIFDQAMINVWKYIKSDPYFSMGDLTGNNIDRFIEVSNKYKQMACNMDYDYLVENLSELFTGEIASSMSNPPSTDWIRETLRKHAKWLIECLLPQYDVLFS